jgi:hypothetical protein
MDTIVIFLSSMQTITYLSVFLGCIWYYKHESRMITHSDTLHLVVMMLMRGFLVMYVMTTLVKLIPFECWSLVSLCLLYFILKNLGLFR